MVILMIIVRVQIRFDFCVLPFDLYLPDRRSALRQAKEPRDAREFGVGRVIGYGATRRKNEALTCFFPGAYAVPAGLWLSPEEKAKQ